VRPHRQSEVSNPGGVLAAEMRGQRLWNSAVPHAQTVFRLAQPDIDSNNWTVHIYSIISLRLDKKAFDTCM